MSCTEQDKFHEFRPLKTFFVRIIKSKKKKSTDLINLSLKSTAKKSFYFKKHSCIFDRFFIFK